MEPIAWVMVGSVSAAVTFLVNDRLVVAPRQARFHAEIRADIDNMCKRLSITEAGLAELRGFNDRWSSGPGPHDSIQ